MPRQKVSPWLILAVITVGAFMSSLNNNIVNVALPSMAAHYGTSPQIIQWVVTAYFLTTGTCLVILGWLSDVSGRRRVYLSGYVLFLLGAALAGLSPRLDLTILFRVLQAVGGAAIVANGMAIIAQAFPPQQRGRALGLQGTIVGAASFFGPTAGGLLTGTLGWRYVFWVNLPVGVVGLALAAVFLPKDRPRAERPPFDFPGAFWYAGAMVSFLWGLTRIGLVSPWEWLTPIVLAGLCLAFFVRRERQSAAPMVDLGLFQNLPFTAGVVSSLAAFMVVSLSNLVMPFYLEQALGVPPQRVGLLLTPLPLASIALAGFSGWLSDQRGGEWLTTVGMGVVTAATISLTFLGHSTPLALVAAGLGAVGAGLGLFTSPNNSEVLNAAPAGKLALANSLLATSRHTGQMLGTTFSAVLFSQLSGVYLARGGEQAAALLFGVRGVYLAGAGLGALGFAFCAWRLVNSRRPAAAVAKEE